MGRTRLDPSAVPTPLSPPAPPTWDGDAAGLICGYAFEPGGQQPVRGIDLEAARVRIEAQAQQPADGAPDASFMWLHFNLSHAPARAWLERHAPLPDSFHEALRETQPSTRVERADDLLLAIINDVHFDFGFEPSDISTLWVAVGPRLVITARARPLRSIDALRTAVRAGHAPQSSTELFEQLMRAQADALVGIVRSVTARIDAVEDALLAGRPDQQRARLGGLRRVLVRLQRLLAPEPAALFRLLHKPPAWMGEADAQGLRDASEEFSVVLRDMGGLQERIKLLQEEIAASVQEDNNRSLFVLTVVTVLALPINILAGLFGMNVGGIPLAEDAHGFWVVVGIVASFTAVAAWIAFRKK
ncbi:transporter [Xenophilus arseniciresistens]|uniref:Transporter n=1 Tax=Xenophilus arseniciresistens TaxID=1283306 RepID=A0AAE3N7H3_9BURK|nr:transporter [Xenophilus arseniciresistens]MDA7416298.1 transporter [Xenophilus arseniciresistens]